MNGRWPATLGVGGILLIAVIGFLGTAIPSLRAHTNSPLAPAARLLPAGTDTGRIPVPAGDRAYFGAQLSWDSDTPAAYASKLGQKPTVYGNYVNFPVNREGRQRLADQARQAASQGGMLMLAMEPAGGLSTVTPAASRDFALSLAAINRAGTPVMVRFAHEMNGSWYPWGQQPGSYRHAFRTVAAAVHRWAPRSAMMWAPNYGGGYPFLGGPYVAKRGTNAFADLDTDGDGRLGPDDDPYSPFYPGDDAVDWVGLTLYHWGNAWPWGENEIPEAGRFIRAIEGRYDGLIGDERGVPNFYRAYAVDHAKPFAIAETAAFFNASSTAKDDPSALAIKSSWWSQLFSDTVHARFPRLRMIMWFEETKEEQGASRDGAIEWRVLDDPATAARFRSALPPWLAFAP